MRCIASYVITGLDTLLTGRCTRARPLFSFIKAAEDGSRLLLLHLRPPISFALSPPTVSATNKSSSRGIRLVLRVQGMFGHGACFPGPIARRASPQDKERGTTPVP